MSEDNAAPMVSADELVADIIGLNNRIWGVPARHLLFQESDRTASYDLIGRDTYGLRPYRMYVAKSAHPGEQSQQTTESGIILASTIGINDVELVPLDLFRIQIESGTHDAADEPFVFSAVETPGTQRYLRRLRIIRVTVSETGYTTYEVLAETRYPPH